MQLSKTTKVIFGVFQIFQGILFQVFLLYVRKNSQKEIETPYQMVVHKSDQPS